MRDEFLSEEDLELQYTNDEELFAYWEMCLQQAQTANDLDEHTYSHGVFTVERTSDQSRSKRQPE
jgi:hypothetical protein